MKQGITFLVLILTTIFATAYDFEHEGLRFTLIDNNELSVSGFSDSQGEYFSDGILTIPDIVTYGRSYSVTRIDAKAFYGSKQIKEVFVPSTVTDIKSSAFAGCTGLIEVTLGNSVKNIEPSAFDNDKLIYKVNISDIEAWCNIIFQPTYEVSDPNIHTGEVYTWYDRCTSNPLYYGAELYIDGEEVNELNIPSSITKIPDFAFIGCTSISTVNFPASVVSIGDRAFYGCEGLKSLDIPNNVTEMGEFVFCLCSNLETLKLGDGLKSIGNSAFYACTSLKSIEWGSAIKEIGSSAFSHCSSLTSLSLPPLLTVIPTYCFARTGLLEVDIPDRIKEVQKGAFYECGNIESIKIGDGVELLGSSAFEGCSAAKTLTIGKSLRESSGFFLCGGLEKITVDPENEYFYCPDGSNTLIDKATNTLLRGCNNSVIPNTVERIGNCAFSGCKSLETIDIPSSVTSIGSLAFCMSGMKSIIIPASVTSIGSYLFEEGVVEIVDIGPSVTSIGEYAFACSTITSFTCRCTTPPTVGDYNDDITSYKVYANVSLYVPEGSAELYREKKPWSKFADIQEFPSGVEMVSVDEFDRAKPVEIYDMRGVKLGSDTIDNLPSGVYIVKQGARVGKIAR